MKVANKVALYGGAFQDTAGNPLAGGTVTFTLSQDSSTNGNGQLCAGSIISFVIDSAGSQTTVSLQEPQSGPNQGCSQSRLD